VRPEIVFTKAAPKTGFSEGQESPMLDNVNKVLEAAGTSLANVVKVGVFLRDMKDFAAPRQGVNVEIDAIAWVPR